MRASFINGDGGLETIAGIAALICIKLVAFASPAARSGFDLDAAQRIVRAGAYGLNMTLAGRFRYRAMSRKRLA
jgi:hypothetical protein